jgi:hypothetical protein
VLIRLCGSGGGKAGFLPEPDHNERRFKKIIKEQGIFMIDHAAIARERDILAKAYNIVDDLAARAPEAGFPAAVGRAEQSRVFHDMLDRIAEMGITPATFIAVHALAQCADNIGGLPEGEDAAALDHFLFDSAQQALGPEIHDHLREWMAGLHMDGAQLEHAGPWAKLGAMSKSLAYFDIFTSPLDQRLATEHPAIISGIIETQGRIAEACKDLGPGLYGYYAGRLEAAVQAIGRGPQRGPGGFAPG